MAILDFIVGNLKALAGGLYNSGLYYAKSLVGWNDDEVATQTADIDDLSDDFAATTTDTDYHSDS